MQKLLYRRPMQRWMNEMNRFFIITNEQRDPNLSLTHSIQDYIAAKGGSSCLFVSNKSDWHERLLCSMKTDDLDADCILVIGGDGTLVRAARDLARIDIPLIGVNMGTLGFLCELDSVNVFDAIDLLFQDQYEIENRMMIEGVGTKDGAEVITTAMNDIVIHRCGTAQMINLVISVNGVYLTTYNADGVIIATPTGSTGYSMSAGGPIVDPKAELLLITPINPHTISGRSIVVGADAEIEVMLSKRRPEQDEEAEVSFDGDRFMRMRVGDRFHIKKSEGTARILKQNQLSFLQILRKKMQEYR